MTTRISKNSRSALPKIQPAPWLGRSDRTQLWIKRIAWGMGVAVVVAVSATAFAFWYFGRGLPTVAALKNYRPPQTTRIMDAGGTVLAEVFTERRTVVPLSRMPRHLVLAVLAAEDADFYRHEGLDYPGVLRAIFHAVITGKATQGASTITQQLVKNLLLTPERTLTRKIRELILARRLEQDLSKDEILHMYLNQINFGHGRYGVQEASRYYFDKDVAQLSLAEASLLAGLPQAPGRLSPRNHPEQALHRRDFVLKQLELKRQEYWPDLPASRIEAARNAPLQLAAVKSATGLAPEITAWVRKELEAAVGASEVERGGYAVHTTLRADLQSAVRAAVRKGLEQLDKRQGYRAPIRRMSSKRSIRRFSLQVSKTYDARVTGADDTRGLIFFDVGGNQAVAHISESVRYNPKSLPASQFAPLGTSARVSVQQLADPHSDSPVSRVALELGPQAAAVVLDARTRAVLAIVGGYEAVAGFDRATQAIRQPGSAFKPIVYALALHTRRFTPASIVLDAPAVYDRWQPRNYETWRYEGPVRLRDALAKSINLVAVRVLEEVSPREAIAFAKVLGITSTLDESLALALGASDVRVIELVNAYATFAAGGQWTPVRLLTKVIGPRGKQVALPALETPRQVLSEAEAYVVTSMMTSVVQEGTAVSAKQLRRPVAGKTGTSNEARDAWFVGYTPRTVAGVWVGFDDRRSLGRGESGAKSALPIWIDILRAAEKGHAPEEFPVPSGIVHATIDKATGLLAYPGLETGMDEVFLEGTAPTETARPPDVADPNTFLMEQMGGNAPETPPLP